MTIKPRVSVMTTYYKNNASPTPTVTIYKLRSRLGRVVSANESPSIQILIQKFKTTGFVMLS